MAKIDQRSLNNSSLICTANTTQILGYLMRKLEEYKENNMEQPPKEAVTVTGLQLCTSSMKVWVLNEHTHVDEHGQYIDPCQSPYIWLAKYLPQNEKHLPIFQQGMLQLRCLRRGSEL